ncbi:unnamed protein product [Jaminaea pallidilutea]
MAATPAYGRFYSAMASSVASTSRTTIAPAIARPVANAGAMFAHASASRLTMQQQQQQQQQRQRRSMMTLPSERRYRPALALQSVPSTASTSRAITSTSQHHFDTHALVTRLESSGMAREQADALVAALNDVISESLSQLEKGCVGREEGEKWRYAQKVDFARLKSEIQLLERNDFAMMKSENERLMADVEKLKQRLREEVTRTVSGVRLSLNLEKGRIRDESSVHALKIKEVDTRIESEIAGVRTSIQSAKFNVLQYLVGVATGAGALLLAFMRFVL